MVTAVCVKCLAKCIIYALSSVKFLGLKLWLCKKKDKYQVWKILPVKMTNCWLFNSQSLVSDGKDAWRGDFRLGPKFWEQIEKKVMLQELCNAFDITKSGFQENFLPSRLWSLSPKGIITNDDDCNFLNCKVKGSNLRFIWRVLSTPSGPYQALITKSCIICRPGAQLHIVWLCGVRWWIDVITLIHYCTTSSSSWYCDYIDSLLYYWH